MVFNPLDPIRRDIDRISALAQRYTAGVGGRTFGRMAAQDIAKLIRNQIQDEREAFETYSRLATLAEQIGKPDMASNLRAIGQQEAEHASTLLLMANSLERFPT